MLSILRKLLKNESGQGMVEYGLIVSLIAIGAVVAVNNFGNNVSRTFSGAATQMNSSGTGSSSGTGTSDSSTGSDTGAAGGGRH